MEMDRSAVVVRGGGGGSGALRFYTASAIESFLPVGRAHVVDLHRFSCPRGMDEFAFAHIDADVAESTFHRVEEHQVARLEFIGVNGFGDFGLLGSPVRQQFAEGLFVEVAYKTAAVKTGVLAGAAPAVRHAQKPHGLAQQVGGLFSHSQFGLRELTGQLACELTCPLGQDAHWMGRGRQVFVLGPSADQCAGQCKQPGQFFQKHVQG